MLREINILKSAAIMVTPQRIAMLRVLLESHTYLEAKVVHRMISHQYPTVSTATIYRTMELFRKKHILKGVEKINVDGGEHDCHSYLVCSECNKCHDLTFPIESLEEYSAQVSKSHNFQVTSQKLTIYGRCPKCQEHG